MSDEITYVGFIGHQNIGDEAIYEATKKLFPSYEFTSYKNNPDPERLLFGGGTMLPAATAGYGDYVFDSPNYCAALGVGLQNPAFHNKKEGVLDVTYHLGQRDIDVDVVLQRAGRLGSIIKKTRLSEIFYLDKIISLRQITNLSAHSDSIF